MTPMIALPTVPVRLPLQGPALPITAVNFEALFSVSSLPVAELPVLPATHGAPTFSPPQVQDSANTMVPAPDADIDAEILPLLATFGAGTAPVLIPAISQTSADDEVSAADIESDEAQSDLREGAEMAAPAPVVIPTANIASTAPVTERDVEIRSGTPAVSVPKLFPRPNAAPALQLPDASFPANQPGATPIADLAGQFASTSVEGNSASGAGFQAIMTEQTIDAAPRPISDATVIVAERALDVARGSLWLDQLAGDIAAAQDTDRDLAFRLIPAQLGQLDVKITAGDDGMQLNFSTQSDEAARIIGSAQSRLVEELKSQGMRVAGSEVNAGSGQPSFAQQTGHPVRTATITEFEGATSVSPEPTHPNEPQNGRFA